MLERVYKVEYPHVVIAAYLAHMFVHSALILFTVHHPNIPTLCLEASSLAAVTAVKPFRRTSPLSAFAAWPSLVLPSVKTRRAGSVSL